MNLLVLGMIIGAAVASIGWGILFRRNRREIGALKGRIDALFRKVERP